LKDKLLELEYKCHEYTLLVKDIKELADSFEEYGTYGIYTLSKFRTKLHDFLCKGFSLNKEDTLEYTDNLDKINYEGSVLFFLLLEKSREKGGKL